MRPIVLLIILTIVIISIRIDLTEGTIPMNPTNQFDDVSEASSDRVESSDEPIDESPRNYQEVIVDPGQTVYGIVIELHDPDSFSIPIHQVIAEFQALNNEVSPHKLLAGEVYKFPLFDESVAETS